MPVTAKWWVELIAVLAAIGAVFYAGWHLGSLKGNAALARAQAAYNASSAAQAQAAFAALNRVKDEEDAIRTANGAVVDALNEHIKAVDDSSAELAIRLRDALASSDHYRGLYQAADLARTSIAARVAGSESRVDALTVAVAKYDGACQRDALKLSALQTEIKPQL